MQSLRQGRMGPQGGTPQRTENKEKTTKHIMFCILIFTKNDFWHLQAEIYPTVVDFVRFGAPRGTATSGTCFGIFSAKSVSLFRPLPTAGRLPCLPMDRSGPGAPDLCGGSCGRPLIWPKVQFLSFFFRASRSSYLILQSDTKDAINPPSKMKGLSPK